MEYFIKSLKISYTKLLIVLILAVFTGCTTVNQLYKKYPGYTVVGKETKEVIKDVPAWTLSCVTPNGNVKCQVKSVASYPTAGVNSCSLSCNTNKKNQNPPDKWIKRQVGTEERTFFEYFLRLQSPAGEEVVHKVSSYRFNEMSEGQVFPTVESK